jgi:hypothetical protein
MDVAEVRRLALDLPDAVEADHHGRPSFRVAGRIFATLPDADAANVMAPEDVILAAVDEAPASYSTVFWGKRLSAVRVELATADPARVEALLFAAWSRRAPRRLVG